MKRILESIGNFASFEVERAWDNEVERRLKEIESGAELGIPAEEVMKKARRALKRFK